MLVPEQHLKLAGTVSESQDCNCHEDRRHGLDQAPEIFQASDYTSGLVGLQRSLWGQNGQFFSKT